MLIQTRRHRWIDLDHCYCSPDRSCAYISIPKNASSWTSDLLKSQGWYLDRNCVDTADHVIVALRNPVDRWTSGIAEYLYRYHPNLTVDAINQHIVDLIFEQIEFDHHTHPQITMLDGLDTDRMIFFAVDREYSNNLATYLNITVDSHHLIPANSVTNHGQKHKLKQFFSDQLTDPRYLSKITGRYQDDFELIKLIHFYEPR